MINAIFENQTIIEAYEILKSQLLLSIWETLYVTLFATFFAVVIGLPLGVILVIGEKNGIRPLNSKLLSVINFIINILRSIPFLILMILVFPLTRLIMGTVVGTSPTIVPLVIAAFPLVARLAESSLREINANTIEMAQSLGASTYQIITKVMIRESIPSLISNLTIATTTILSYTAMSGIIGGGGLGKIAINYGYYRYKTLVMIVAVIFLVLLVQAIQTLGTKVAVKLDKRNKK
jgi:D-methionine transport system permease protein